jgi:uncharacterized protein (TIGR02147 family)
MNKNNETPSEISVFDYDDSLQYIKDVIESQGYGYKAKLSEAIQCQSAYVSRVLGGLASFSLEQSERLNHFFAHSNAESDYFLTLSMRDRAGTAELKNYFNSTLQKLKKQRLDLKNHVAVSSEISERDRHVYFSSWIYGAIYVLTSIPEFQTIEAMSKRLRIPQKKMLAALDFLTGVGLVKKENSRYILSNSGMHIGSDNTLVTRHHLNWRTKALAAVEANKPEELHYSVAISVSEKDAEIIKEKLVNVMAEIQQILEPSKEEVAKVITLDFFDL